MNGSRFLERLVYVWVYFQILSGMSLPKLNLSTSGDTVDFCCVLKYGYGITFQFDPFSE